jgi:HEPN domain-containing protein
LEKGRSIEKIHDLVDLANRIKELGWSVELNIEDAIFLNSVYKSRYLTEEGLLPYGEPTKDDAERALDCAKKFIAWMNKIMKACPLRNE